ncbi:MAG TPA: AAA family ATPase [Longimicrobiales bacterium]
MTRILKLYNPDAATDGRPSLPEFVPTPTAERVFKTLWAVHQLGDLGVVRGSAGLGKTTAIREYERRHPGVFVFTMSELIRNKQDVAQLISDRLYISTYSLFEFAGRLKERLRSSMLEGEEQSFGRWLFVFDEAQHMTLDAVSMLRSISDATGAGMVFAGNHGVLRSNRVGSNRSSLRQAPLWTGELAQVKSRVSGWCEIEGCEPGDVLAFLEACGISAEREDLMAFLWEWAQKPGGLRNVQKILTEALRMEQGWPFTTESLDAAVDSLALTAPGRLA